MNIEERYNEVEVFNEIAGNLDNVTVEKLEAQMKVFIEESKETAAAFENKDAVELLDGICDSFVTLAGLMQMAEELGFAVNEALKRVNRNNLDKYISRVVKDDEFDHYDSLGWTAIYNNRYDCYVLKDENGKIRKPVGFVPVEIAALAPNIFEGAA